MLLVLCFLLSLFGQLLAFHQLSPILRHRNNVNMAKGFGLLTNNFKYTGNLRPGKIQPKLDVPPKILKPDYAKDGSPKLTSRGNPWDITPQTPEDIARMRVAGRIAREVLDEAVKFVRPGVKTMEIDEVVHRETIKRSSYPSPLNYQGCVFVRQ